MMDEPKDPPIEELEYVGGVTVIDIGDIRVSRGMTRRHVSSCKHRRITYDPRERRVWCRDCERDLDPFDAFVGMVEQFNAAAEKINARARNIAEAEKFAARSLAVKELDRVWRGRSMVPACPHCGYGLLPELFSKGLFSTLGRDYAVARIKAKPPRP